MVWPSPQRAFPHPSQSSSFWLPSMQNFHIHALAWPVSHFLPSLGAGCALITLPIFAQFKLKLCLSCSTRIPWLPACIDIRWDQSLNADGEAFARLLRADFGFCILFAFHHKFFFGCFIAIKTIQFQRISQPVSVLPDTRRLFLYIP